MEQDSDSIPSLELLLGLEMALYSGCSGLFMTGRHLSNARSSDCPVLYLQQSLSSQFLTVEFLVAKSNGDFLLQDYRQLNAMQNVQTDRKTLSNNWLLSWL